MSEWLQKILAQWKTIVVVWWMIFVAVSIFQIERHAERSADRARVKRIRFGLDSVEDTVYKIDAKVDKMARKLSSVDSTVDSIERDLRKMEK